MELSAFIVATFLSFSSAQAPAPAPAPSIEKIAEGQQARTLFFSELRAHMEDGYTLVGLMHSDAGIELTFMGAETIILSADLDAEGRVTSTRVSVGAEAPDADEHAAVPVADIVELASLPTDARLSVAKDAPELRIHHRGRLLASLPIGAVVIDESMME